MIKKEEVIARYNRSSQALADHEKALWGSEDSMLGRFKLALEIIGWGDISRWIDVGCGVGRLFSYVDPDGTKVQEKVGVDISPELINQARRREFNGSVRFELGDLEHLSTSHSGFDLISLIGVLQLCGCEPNDALSECARVLRNGGQIFLTTKNSSWSKFDDVDFEPSDDHDWFDSDLIVNILRANGFEILNMGGILPKSGELVTFNESHTMYFRAIKKSA